MFKTILVVCSVITCIMACPQYTYDDDGECQECEDLCYGADGDPFIFRNCDRLCHEFYEAYIRVVPPEQAVYVDDDRNIHVTVTLPAVIAVLVTIGIAVPIALILYRRSTRRRVSNPVQESASQTDGEQDIQSTQGGPLLENV